VPVWPACWGYSCTGPTTYFGPASLQSDLVVSLDVRLEDHGALTIEPQGMSYKGLTLDSAGSWSLGSATGSLDFGVDSWHAVELTMGSGWQAASVDGKALANISGTVGRFSATDTCDDDAFPVDLAGKQYMGLSAASADIASAEECRQACCDMGSACHIYQFSETPSQPTSKCWIGDANSFSTDPEHNYVSRGRDLAGWNLKVSLSRYIFASFDNFEIKHLSEATGPAMV